MARKSLFRSDRTTAAFDKKLPWSIDCTALKQADLETIVKVMRPYLDPYSHVVGVPGFGERFATFFAPFVEPEAKSLLVVSGLWVTGHSIRQVLDKEFSPTQYSDWQGAVIFAQSRPSIRVRYFMLAML